MKENFKKFIVPPTATIKQAYHKMLKNNKQIVFICDDNLILYGLVTDGDLRRLVEKDGADAVSKKVGELDLKMPHHIESSALLYHAQQKFASEKVDELVVLEDGKVVGMLDVQDLL